MRALQPSKQLTPHVAKQSYWPRPLPSSPLPSPPSRSGGPCAERPASAGFFFHSFPAFPLGFSPLASWHCPRGPWLPGRWTALWVAL